MPETLLLPVALGVLAVGLVLWSIGGGAWLRVYGMLLAALLALAAGGASVALVVLALEHWQDGGAWLLGFLPASLALAAVMLLLARTLGHRQRAHRDATGG